MTYFAEGTSPTQDEKNGPEIRVVKIADFLSKDVSISAQQQDHHSQAVFEKMGGLRQTTPSTFHLDDFNLILKMGTEGPCVVLLRRKQLRHYRSPEPIAFAIPGPW